MKRILSILASVGLVATASTAVVSCSAKTYGVQNLTSIIDHASFVSASIPQVKDTDWTNGQKTTREIDISGVGLDYIKDFNIKNFNVVGNATKKGFAVDYSNSKLMSDSQIVIMLSDPIAIPAPGDDPTEYTVTYKDTKNNIDWPVILYVQTVNTKQ